MPEGPEIRRAADEVAAAIAGKRTEKVFFAFDRLKHFEPMLSGEMVDAVETRGKAMLTRFANDYNIYSHNQLYGRWVIRDAYDWPQTNRQLRLAIHNPEKSALLYSASEIEVLHNSELADHPFLSKLGPDLMDPDVTEAEVIARFRAEEFQRRRLTTLLLDQGFLAGTGNYLRSEILFTAGVHPSLRPMDCTDEQLDALGRAALMLTRRSYATQGITNDPDRAAALKAAGWKWDDYRFQVFRRDGQGCFICGELIRQDRIGGRGLYYCPHCQAEK
ncbi:MAG: endonuclease VIII [Caldilineaceae bacterium]|nr:endonuclease VIII [Caldilineaceae bacterium]